jgi:hypothetical protein
MIDGLNYRPANVVWQDTRRQLISPPKGLACPLWPKFTQFLGGLRENEVTLLCAPTGAGKTQLLANISVQLLSQSVPHFCAPVETGDVDFLARVASVFAKRDLNDGDPVPAHVVDGLSKGFEESGLFNHLYLATYDNRVDIEEMVSLLKYMHQEYGVKLALLDNLNFFLKVTSAQMERAEMDNAMHEFVMLVKKLPIHVILIVHPRKTDGGRVESEFDIKGSSAAVQECANCCLFNRPKQEDIEKGIAFPTDREMVFKKIRKRGHYVNKVIRFKFVGGRYEEYK